MNKTKRLLMLGGADIQVSAIKKAKELGYYVITCDYLPNNPGHKYSDEYHNISTTEKEAVLDLAKTLNLDGVLAYASDPAALTAAYVAESLGLPTNSYDAVEILSRKDLFRNFMRTHGFLMPKAKAVKNYSEAQEFLKGINKAAIIKPVDSSGSKGIFKIENDSGFEELFNKSLSFSRVGIVIIEEFIVKKGYQIGGDGFLVNGKLVFRCFGDIHFSKSNPVLPCSVSIPTLHSEKIIKKVHKVIQELLLQSGMTMGALNFDVLVDENDEVYILEIGARNGGNMIPELTFYSTGVDMIECSIKAAIGEPLDDLKLGEEEKYFSHYVVHSNKSGVVQDFVKSEKLQSHLLYEHYNFEVGQSVEKFNSSANRLGIMLLNYNSKEEMIDLIYGMENYFKLHIKE